MQSKCVIVLRVGALIYSELSSNTAGTRGFEVQRCFVRLPCESEFGDIEMTSLALDGRARLRFQSFAWVAVGISQTMQS